MAKCIILKTCVGLLKNEYKFSKIGVQYVTPNKTSGQKYCSGRMMAKSVGSSRKSKKKKMIQPWDELGNIKCMVQKKKNYNFENKILKYLILL